MKNQSKKSINLVNISGMASLGEGMCSFLPSYSRPQADRVHKKRHFGLGTAEGQGSPRHIMYKQYPFSK